MRGAVDRKIGIVFSSGFFGFFAHGGFLAGVRELGLRPVAFSGASSGSILAAMAACGMSDEQIREALFSLKKEDFWDPDPWYKVLAASLRFLKGYTGYLRGGRFQRLLEKRLPVRSFEQCPLPLAVVATNISLMREEVFTKGDLIKAIAASGAVPGLFKPVQYQGWFLVDGGVSNKAPIKAVMDLTPLDTIIVHFVASGTLSAEDNNPLNRKFTPFQIHRCAFDIGRYECYRRQCQMARDRGVKILEINSESPAVGPGTLHRGPLAYKRARDATLSILPDLLS